MRYALAKMLRVQLKTKFGRLPKWADERLKVATSVQIDRWMKKFVRAETIEGVLGKKYPPVYASSTSAGSMRSHKNPPIT